MKLKPEPYLVHASGTGRVEMTLDTEDGKRYFVDLLPNGGASVAMRAYRGETPYTRIMRPSRTTAKLIRAAKQMLATYNERRRDEPGLEAVSGTSEQALPKTPAGDVWPSKLEGAPLILPPSPPPPATTTGYLTVIGARHLAEQLLIAARQVEEAVNLVGPDAGTHATIRAGAYIALRIEP